MPTHQLLLLQHGKGVQRAAALTTKTARLLKALLLNPRAAAS